MKPGKILLLDEATQRKIAAGEVIICATGVIKELLENSIDAGATAVEIIFDNNKLQLTDNGTGVLKEDLMIICNRFTTSKITKYDDLLTIASFGFRGEALSAVSCVSKLTIQTKHATQELGYVCQYSDYKQLSCIPKAMNIGTTIIVADLFYNLPNRKMGIRSYQSELNACLRMVQSYSIEYPFIKFTLKKGSQKASLPVLNTISNSRFNRLNAISTVNQFIALYKNDSAILNDDQVDQAILPEINNNELIRSVLFISSHPQHVITGTQSLFILFINQRLVVNSTIKKLIYGFFESYLPKGKHPFCFLSLQLRPQILDVNVHPSKKEIVISCEDKIVDLLTELLQNKIQIVQKSKEFQIKVLDSATQLSQSVLTVPKQSADNLPKKRDFKDLIDKYSYKKSKIIAPSQLKRTNSKDMKLTTFYNKSSQNAIASSQLNELSQIDSVKPDYDIIQLKYTVHDGLTNLLKNHVFVGLIEKSYVLMQHDIDLYMIPAKNLCLDVFYSCLLTCSEDCGAFTLPKSDILVQDDKIKLFKSLGCTFDNNKLSSFPLISHYFKPKCSFEELFDKLKSFDCALEIAQYLSRAYMNIVDTADMSIAIEELLQICKMSHHFKFINFHLPAEKVEKLANLKELYKIFERC